MTGIDISAGRTVLVGHLDLSLGRLHEMPLNNAQESSSYIIVHILIHIYSNIIYSIDPSWLSKQAQRLVRLGKKKKMQ
jgi:hypothetical protein